MSYLSNLNTGKYFQRCFVDKPFVVARAPNMYHKSAAVASSCVPGTVFCSDVGSHLVPIWSAAGSPTARGREQGSGRAESGRVVLCGTNHRATNLDNRAPACRRGAEPCRDVHVCSARQRRFPCVGGRALSRARAARACAPVCTDARPSRISVVLCTNGKSGNMQI